MIERPFEAPEDFWQRLNEKLESGRLFVADRGDEPDALVEEPPSLKQSHEAISASSLRRSTLDDVLRIGVERLLDYLDGRVPDSPNWDEVAEREAFEKELATAPVKRT